MRCKLQNFRSCVCAGIIAVAVCLLPNISALVRNSDSKRSIRDAEALVREVMHNEIESHLGDDSLMHDLAHQCLCISNAPLGVGVTNQCGNIGEQANGNGDNASANARPEVLKLAAHSAETALLLHANHIHFI